MRVTHVFVILRQDHFQDELAVMKTFAHKSEAKEALKAFCLATPGQPVVKVVCLPLSYKHEGS
jgi:hypothetical protein